MKNDEKEKIFLLGKIAPYVLDFVIVIGTFVFGYLLFFIGVPEANKDIMNIMFGTLLGLCSTVVNYHRGSSEGSTAKQLTLNKIASTNKEGLGITKEAL